MAHALQSSRELRLAPFGPRRSTWGGARNRADRSSEYLTSQQAVGIIAAAAYAEQTGRPFNRHWTVHYERAGIADRDGAAFTGRLLRLVGATARRSGGELAAAWARENGEGKGGHVHILMHLPAGLHLRNRTTKWIKAAGGTVRARVSRVRSIGGRLTYADALSWGEVGDLAHYQANVDAVLGYLLKGVDSETGEALGLPQHGVGGSIVGKRAGWTQNIGAAARLCQNER